MHSAIREVPGTQSLLGEVSQESIKDWTPCRGLIGPQSFRKERGIRASASAASVHSCFPSRRITGGCCGSETLESAQKLKEYLISVPFFAQVELENQHYCKLFW